MAYINIQPDRPGLFSLQEASQLYNTSINGDYAAITLYSNGCSYTDENSTTQNNCSHACQKPGVVWANPNTIHNCMAYFKVSELLGLDNLTSESRDNALSLGYLPEPQINITLFRNPIELCMIDYCEQSWPTWNAEELGGNCARNFTSMDNNYTWQNTVHEKFLDQACSGIRVGPNMDVGGVGVYIGYLTQLSILIYCWLHGRLMANWTRFATVAIFTPFEGHERAQKRSQRVQLKLTTSHQSAALISGLSEFQKSQSFFTLTLQGTAIGALASNGSMFDADSLQEMHLTVDLLGDVAATGIICLTFGLYMLHAANKRSWYTTCLSVLAVLISCVTWTMIRMPLENLHQMRPTEHDLPACGGRSPATYCLKKDNHKITYFEAASMAVCLLATILMITRQSGMRITSIGLSRQTSIAVTASETNSAHLSHISTVQTTTSRAKRALEQVAEYSVRLEMAELVMAGLTVTMFVRLLTNGEMSAMHSSVSWTFGQLIAVTIWIPSILEYAYATLTKFSLAERKPVRHILHKDRGTYIDAAAGSTRGIARNIDDERSDWWPHARNSVHDDLGMRDNSDSGDSTGPGSIRSVQGDARHAAIGDLNESAERTL